MTANDPAPLSPKRVLRFWTPLAGTWLLMAIEGLVLAAIIARLPMPRENLAAYGVAFAFAIIVEAPVILLMSASTALVKDAEGYRALATFTRRLNLGVTAVMALLVLPPVWSPIATMLGLTAEVAGLVHAALLWLLPWPAAIGDRRFHQGILIRHHRTTHVALGTLARLAAMLLVALSFAAATSLDGASVAAAALSAGVLTEMVIVRRMAAPVVRPLREAAAALPPRPPADLTQRAVARFYAPMALTSVIALISQPLITFFMGQAPRSIESLAVLPVINGLTFVFRALALSYQEVAIALMGDRGEHFRRVRDIALGLVAAVLVAMAAIAFTPLAEWWLGRVAGLDPALVRFARLPLMIYAFLPMLSVLQCLQRAILVHGRATAPLSTSTAIEVGVLALALLLAIEGLGWAGAVAAGTATLLGRAVGLAALLGPTRAAVRRLGAASSPRGS